MVSSSKPARPTPKRIATIVLPALLLAAVLFIPSAAAESRPDGKKVVLVVVDAATVEDLISGSSASRILERGAAGLMNARAANAGEVANFYLSIGAGARAEAGTYGDLGFNAKEQMPRNYYQGLLSAREVFRQIEGRKAPDRSVINLSANFANSKSFKYRSNILPGLLGETLRRAGRKTAVVGNADTMSVIRRPATLITMDFQGVTDFGDVSQQTLKVDKTFPGGLRTDTAKLARLTLEMASKADLTTVEFGDTSRIESQRHLMKKVRFMRERAEVFRSADTFIGRLLDKLPLDRTLLIVTSPRPFKDPARGIDNLVPVLTFGLGRGVLISDTTRRGGIIANMDVAPTILDYLGVPRPVEMAGSVMKAKRFAPGSIPQFLTRRHSEIYALRQLRTPFLITYSALKALGLIFAFIVMAGSWFGNRRIQGYARPSKAFLLLLLTVPIASLVQPAVNENNLLFGVGAFLAIAITLTALAWPFLDSRPMVPLIIVSGMTAAIISLDALSGAVLADKSFFGSDLMSGGRFYGIGNTLMGIVVATTVVAAAGFLQLVRSRGPAEKRTVRKSVLPLLAVSGLFVIAVIVGHPRIGANVGGLITSVATALMFRHITAGAKLNHRAVLANAGAFAVIVSAILRLDLIGGKATSHAGKAMAAIQSKGSSEVVDIIIRKLRMNTRGIFTYDMAVILLMIFLIYLFARTLGGVKDFWGRLNSELAVFSRGLSTLIWAALVAYTVNDTGTVAAAAILTYLSIPLFYLLLDPQYLSAIKQDKRTLKSKTAEVEKLG